MKKMNEEQAEKKMVVQKKNKPVHKRLKAKVKNIKDRKLKTK